VTDTFHDRLTVAQRHEHDVSEHLRDCGWLVAPWGQEMLSERIRKMLKMVDRTNLRWQPDIIAVRDGRLIMVDAKYETDRNALSPNFAVEKASVDALHLLGMYARHVVYFAWRDMTATPVHDVASTDDKWTGPHFGTGSGTPYWLVPKCSVSRIPLREL
jgi:hypothetical protein